MVEKAVWISYTHTPPLPQPGGMLAGQQAPRWQWEHEQEHYAGLAADCCGITLSDRRGR